MINDAFLLNDKKDLIDKSFINNGWLTIYKYEELNQETINIFCCLVRPTFLKKYLQNYHWGIDKGQEGIPSISESKKREKKTYIYKTHTESGLLPFIFYKSFSVNGDYLNYIDISEEFTLYFKLYERRISDWNRKYYYIDEVGDLEEVIIIELNQIVIKLKFLMEYISIRKLHFSIGFDFMRLSSVNLNEQNIKPKDENLSKSQLFYNHLIRDLNGHRNDKAQSWIYGKKVIKYDRKFNNYHFESSFVDFIIGYDNFGKEQLQSCRIGLDTMLTMVFFKKEVLNKYFNDPDKYEVSILQVKSNFFSITMDNDSEDDYVTLFLDELGKIPYKEQLHWKTYNIAPPREIRISKAFYKSMIHGELTNTSESIDLFFKEKYKEFNKLWEMKFGWKFYKPLAKEDMHIFKSLHLPTTNNVKSFSEQILTIAKVTIDRLNDKEIGKNIESEKNDRSITKLEKYVNSKGIKIPEMFEFLRNLWVLRSGLLAHSFSKSNKECKKAMNYFGFDNKNYIEVAKNIFSGSINTLNTLESEFLK